MQKCLNHILIVSKHGFSCRFVRMFPTTPYSTPSLPYSKASDSHSSWQRTAGQYIRQLRWSHYPTRLIDKALFVQEGIQRSLFQSGFQGLGQDLRSPSLQILSLFRWSYDASDTRRGIFLKGFIILYLGGGMNTSFFYTFYNWLIVVLLSALNFFVHVL